MHTLYKEFYKQRVFTIDEANKIIKNYQVCRNTIHRLIKEGYIKRIKSGLYNIVPLDEPGFEPNQIHIATKLQGIISHNTALHLHKIHKKEPTIYILTQSSKKMRIKDITHKKIKTKQNIGIINLEYQTGYNTITIRITDLERSILDVVWTKTIRLEDLIAIIKGYKNTTQKKLEINSNKLISYIEKYKKPILYNKIGLLLDITKDSIIIQEEDLEKIRKKLGKKIYYYKDSKVSLIRPRYKYNKQWNIMIPEQIQKTYYKIPIPDVQV